MKTYLYIVLLVSLSVVYCTKESTTGPEAVSVEDLLPRGNEISGWTRTGNSWIARSSGDLNTYINGEEPLYTRHGFVEAAMQEYQGSVLGTTKLVELRIFDQGNGTNAAALFDEYLPQLINPVDWDNGAGDEAKIETIPGSYHKIVFRKSKYFVYLVITSGLTEALDILKTFANNVDTKMG